VILYEFDRLSDGKKGSQIYYKRQILLFLTIYKLAFNNPKMQFKYFTNWLIAPPLD
jgi:hypothetical protein